MRVYIILLISLMIGACTPRQLPFPEPSKILPAVEVQSSPVATSTEADKMASLAIADLVSRFSVNQKDVNILSMESQLWPDAALGCPRLGQVYSQQTVPGYRLLLEANDLEYIYHTDAKETVILCLEEDLPSLPVTPGEIDDGVPWMPVD